MANRFYEDDDEGRSSDEDNSSNDATTSTDDDDDDDEDVVEAVPVRGNGDDESEDDEGEIDESENQSEDDNDSNEEEDNEEEEDDDDESTAADAVVVQVDHKKPTVNAKVNSTSSSSNTSNHDSNSCKKKIIKLTLRKKTPASVATATTTSAPATSSVASSNTSAGDQANARTTASTSAHSFTSPSVTTSTTTTKTVSSSSSISSSTISSNKNKSTKSTSLSKSSRWKLPLQSNKMKLPTKAAREQSREFNTTYSASNGSGHDEDDDDDDDDDEDIQTAVVVSAVADDENDDTTTVTAIALPLNQSDDDDVGDDNISNGKRNGNKLIRKNGPSSSTLLSKPTKQKTIKPSSLTTMSSSTQSLLSPLQPSPKKHKPSTSQPSLVSEKRILLYAGPADSLPPGWTIKHYKRTTGLKHTDRYWFSPMLKKKFRSLAQVGRFLEFLTRENGDEAKAWDMFRNSPPGPDEIRSGRLKGSGGGGSVKSGDDGSGGGGGGYVVNDGSGNSGNSLSVMDGGARNGATSKGSSSSSSGSRKRQVPGSGNNNSRHGHFATSHQNGARALRVPPIVSPGLYAHPTASLLQKKEQQSKAETRENNNGDAASQSLGPKIETNTKGYVTPSTIFDHALFSAGYTREKINEAKYKGSSIIRRVDDMFDSSFQLDYTESDFFPKGLLTEVIESENDESGIKINSDGAGEGTENDSEDNLNFEHVQKKQRLLPHLLIDQLTEAQSLCRNGRTYKHAMQFEDMIPKTLVKPISKSEIAQYKEYYKKIREREEALQKFQKQKYENEDLMDEYEDSKEEWNFKKEEHEKAKRRIAEKAQQALLKGVNNGTISSPTKDSTTMNSADKSTKKEEENLAKKNNETSQDVSNNKKNEENNKCKNDKGGDMLYPMPAPPILPAPIQVPPVPTPPQLAQEKSPSEGGIDDKQRHLISHLDPKCFLPNGRYEGLLSNNFADPQFVGPNAPGISMNSSSNGSGLATAYAGSAAVIERLSSVGMGNGLSGHGGNTKRGSANNSGKGSANNAKSKSSNASLGAKSKKSGLSQSLNTSSSMQLKKLMERGGDEARAMRDSIISAAVYASRSGTHGGSFIGSTGEMYPEISKAFSNYGNLRPCGRCKNNKQGAYHCRLRRKHQDLDFDGGNSADVLKPLFKLPIEDLLVKPKSNNM